MPRSGLEIARAGTPAARRRWITPVHPELSAKAPWTRATVGAGADVMFASVMAESSGTQRCDADELSAPRTARRPRESPWFETGERPARVVTDIDRCRPTRRMEFTMASTAPPVGVPPTVSIASPSFGPLKQVEADLLSVGYAEAGPAGGPPVVL